MKTPPTTPRHTAWTTLAIAALCLPANLALGTPLLSDDFESYTVAEPVPSGGIWNTLSFTGGSLLVLDENTDDPFGAPNRYLEVIDNTDDGSGPATRLQSQPIAATLDDLTTFSFDFFEPSSGGDGRIYVGYAIDSGDLNTAGRRIRISLDDGVIGEVTGGTNFYSLDTTYRLHVIFNDTDSAVSYSAGSIASGTAAVWLEDPSAGTFTFAGVSSGHNPETVATAYSVAFRTFSNETQTSYLDNVSLVVGAPEIPPVPLLEDDFEGYTADEPVSAGGNWSNVTISAGTLEVRDENTDTPFGETNQFVNYDHTESTGALRLQSQPFAAALNAITTFSFDFYEPGSGGSNPIQVGYAIDNLDLVSTNRRFNITLNDGVVGGVSGGNGNTYILDAPYRLHIIFNDTDSTVTYPGGSIASGTADVWLENLSTGIVSFAGTRNGENPAKERTSYSVAFRTFTNALQTIYLDNVSLVLGAPDIAMIDDDFESYTTDETIPAGGSWTNLITSGGSVTVRNETTATPFGSPNQYLEFDDTSDTLGLRLLSRSFTSSSNAVTTFAFDFVEPSTGGGNSATVGYAIDTGDLNSTNGRVIVTLSNGVLGALGGLTGGTNTYDVDAAYRLYIIFNDTDSPVDYPGGSVASGTAAVWLKEISSGTFTFAGTTDALNTGSEETSYSVGFRNFNPNLQTIYLDNAFFAMGAAAIPDTPPVGTGFDSWASTNGADGQSLSDDHDNDGVSNGIEFFLGGPDGDTTGFTALPGVTNNAGTLSVTWTKGSGYDGTYGTDFWVETSETLANPWTMETEGVNVTITGDDVKYTFPAGTKNFARLVVTGP